MKHAASRIETMLLALLLLCCPTLAQKAPSTEYHGEPISLALRDAKLEDVLASLAHVAAITLEFEDGFTPSLPVTVELDKVPWDQALEQIRKTSHLRYEWLSEDHVIVHPESARGSEARALPLDREKRLPYLYFAFDDADIWRVLETLSEKVGATQAFDTDLSGRVELILQGVSWERALDMVCESVGCRWRLREGPGRSRTLFVESAPPSQKSVSFDYFDGADARDAMRALAGRTGLGFLVEGELDGQIIMRARGITRDTALDAIAESLGWEWQEIVDPPAILVRAADHPIESLPLASLERRVDLDLVDAPVGDVLESLALTLGAVLDLSDDVSGSYSATLQQVALYEALDDVCVALQCEWLFEVGTAGRTLKIR